MSKPTKHCLAKYDANKFANPSDYASLVAVDNDPVTGEPNAEQLEELLEAERNREHPPASKTKMVKLYQVQASNDDEWFTFYLRVNERLHPDELKPYLGPGCSLKWKEIKARKGGARYRNAQKTKECIAQGKKRFMELYGWTTGGLNYRRSWGHDYYTYNFMMAQ